MKQVWELGNGCSGRGGAMRCRPSAQGTTKTLTFGVIAKSQSNPVFQAALKGAQAAAKDFSKDGTEIRIEWRTPNEEDAQKQADNIEQLVSAGVNGIAISCSDATKVTKAIDDAVAKGVPVICFDSDAPQSRRFAYFGVDDVETGARVMDELAKVLGGRREGSPCSRATRLRRTCRRACAE